MPTSNLAAVTTQIKKIERELAELRRLATFALTEKPAEKKIVKAKPPAISKKTAPKKKPSNRPWIDEGYSTRELWREARRQAAAAGVVTEEMPVLPPMEPTPEEITEPAPVEPTLPPKKNEEEKPQVKTKTERTAEIKAEKAEAKKIEIEERRTGAIFGRPLGNVAMF